MRRLAWTATWDKKLHVAWTLAGIVRVKAFVIPSVFFFIKTKRTVYATYVGTYRIAWTRDLTSALDIAEHTVMAHMTKRRDRA